MALSNEECAIRGCDNTAHWVFGTRPEDVFFACAYHGCLFGTSVRAICDHPRCRNVPDDRPTRVLHAGGGVQQFCSEHCADEFTSGAKVVS